MSAIRNIILQSTTEELENLLSPFIREQFPQFIRSDYPKLVLFIKAYYEWLEQEGNAGYVVSKLDSIYDVDQNEEEFYDHFKKTYLSGFPELFATNTSGNKPNKKTLLKKIRDFYGNKGTKSAYEFLFRVLYDSDLEIYYPKTDILKASDGQWIEPRSIKTTSTNGTDLFSGKNGYIYQYDGTQLVASAFVNSVVQYSFNGLPITEFFITDINGSFVPGKTVKIVKDSSEWTETPYSVLGQFFIEVAGRGYRVGDTITATDSNGVGFAAKIDQTGLAGGIKRIGISNSGLNYSGDIIVNIFSESGSQTAKVVALRSAVTNYPGYFSGNRGKVSSNKKIQDGHYYQDFSYELKSEVSFDVYFGVLKSVIHPSGMRMFGSILVKKSLDNSIQNATQATYRESPIIGRYTPYTVGTTIDLRDNGVTTSGYWLGATGDLYPLGYNPYIGSTTEVGPNGSTTQNGTVFVGSSLGYTWCYVPESGNTSHNPIGAPLGSSAAWYSGRESKFTPEGMPGLVLWLKPENIGVCGSVVSGASVDVWRDASPSQNHAIPPTWSKWSDDVAIAGVTIDKLRPTLVINDNSVAGATGVYFNEGSLTNSWTIWRGATNYGYPSGTTLGGLGVTFAPGTTGEKLLTARHLWLQRGLTLTADCDIFVVFRTDTTSTSRNYAFVGSWVSPKRKTSNTLDDAIIQCRSYNASDRLLANQNNTSAYSFVGTQKAYFDTTSSLSFNPWRGGISLDAMWQGTQSTANGIPVSNRGTIAYDPHVSIYDIGRIVGEVGRYPSNVLFGYLNGDRATNRSRSTGLGVRRSGSNSLLPENPECVGSFVLGRFGGYIYGPSQINVQSPDFGSNAWVTAWISASTGNAFRGVINEVIVFDRALSESERQEVYGYLSRKYRDLESKLPDSYTRSHPSSYSLDLGLTYWNIEHHPNTKNTTTIPAGICFGGVTLSKFFKLPDAIYKSSGTRLEDGTILSGDTYSNVGL